MQLTLALDGDVQPKVLSRTAAQEASFQSILMALRQETQQILSAAIQLSETHYDNLREVPTPLLIQARQQVLGCCIQSVARLRESSSHRKSVTYRGWSLQAKYGLRCKRLMARIRKRSTLFYYEELQAKVLTNPEYWGMCPLPSEGVCVCNPGQRLQWARAAAAKARELDIRLADADSSVSGFSGTSKSAIPQ